MVVLVGFFFRFSRLQVSLLWFLLSILMMLMLVFVSIDSIWLSILGMLWLVIVRCIFGFGFRIRLGKFIEWWMLLFFRKLVSVLVVIIVQFFLDLLVLVFKWGSVSMLGMLVSVRLGKLVMKLCSLLVCSVLVMVVLLMMFWWVKLSSIVFFFMGVSWVVLIRFWVVFSSGKCRVM